MLTKSVDLLFPWPATIPQLADRKSTPESACVLCDAATPVSYAWIALCLACSTSADLMLRLSLRSVLRACFTLNAAGSRASAAECASALQTQAALWSDVGPVHAPVIVRVTARQWHAETGICPWCAERGPLHGPETDAEAAQW